MQNDCMSIFLYEIIMTCISVFVFRYEQNRITYGYLMVHLKMNGWQSVWIESKAKIYSVQKRKFLVNFWIEFTDFRIEAQLYHEKHRIGLL